MAKAALRTDPQDTARTSSALSLGTVIGPGDGDDGPRLRAVPTTAAELLREIERLFAQLQALRGQPSSPAHQDLEAQIRRYSDRYRTFEDWNAVSAPINNGWGTRRPLAARPATAATRLTHVW